jgi:plastocyanin
VLTDLSISDGTNGQVLTTDGSGGFTFTTISGGSGGDYSDSDVNAHLNTTSAASSEVLSWTGSDFDWVAQSGETNQNAFSNVSVSGQTNVTADNSTDTLTFAASTGISLSTSGNTVTIASTVSAGASNFDDLGDVTTAGLRIDQIYEPAIAMLRVDNVGTGSYTFPSHYTGNNPTIYAISGTTIAFDLDNISGHPFEIQDNTLTALTSNLVHVTSTGTVSTNSAAQGKSSGTLYWRIPEGSPGTYVYQCTSHASMFGSITVKDLSNI